MDASFQVINRRKNINIIRRYLSALLGMQVSSSYAASLYDEQGNKILKTAYAYLYNPSKSKKKDNKRQVFLPLHGLPAGYERHWDEFPVGTSLGGGEFYQAHSNNGMHRSEI